MAFRRTAFLSIVLFLLGVGFGCAASPREEPKFSFAHPGAQAAAVFEARAASLQDRIRLCGRDLADAEKRRDGFVRDAAAYRTKSAGVWTDTGLSDRERGVMARQYSAIAADADAQADRCQELVGSYAGEIALLECKRKDRLYQARKFESMVEPLSE